MKIISALAAALALAAPGAVDGLEGLRSMNAAELGNSGPAAAGGRVVGPLEPEAAAPPLVLGSYGRYASWEQAGAAMDKVIAALLPSGAVILKASLAAGYGGYRFEITFKSEYGLAIHQSGAVFASEAEARESMRGMSALLADGRRTIVLEELIDEGFGNFSYAIVSLEGVEPRPDYL